MFKYISTLILCLGFISVFGMPSEDERVFVIDENFEQKIIGEYIELFIDNENLSLEEVIEKNEFIPNTSLVPNLGVIPSTVWVKIPLKNNSSRSSYLLNIEFPILDEIEMYYPSVSKGYSSILLDEVHLEKKTYQTPDYVFDIWIPKGQTRTYYLRLKNTEQIIVPVSIKTEKSFWEGTIVKDVVNGVFIGIILIMFLYNLFVFFSTRDKSYLYYVIYVLSVGLTHMGIQGYSLNYFFPTLTIDGGILTIYGATAGISVILFTKSFLETRTNARKLDYGLTFIGVILLVSIILMVAGANKQLAFSVHHMGTVLFSIYILVVSYYLVFKGYRPAKFVALSMTILLVGAIIFLLKDFGILPYNNITNYTMLAASALEMALLSFALANKINIFRDEKETAQEEALKALQENEKIIREQNIVLEQKVTERTSELNDALTHLKETQSQLVTAEKMSSLGQLTAGIAHEINNPINFVSSSIFPLRQDIDDLNVLINKYEEIDEKTDIKEKLQEVEKLKEELDYDYLKTEVGSIIDNIEEGAKRAAQIVSGLRTFSRLDESELKSINMNEGIESTIVLIKNKLNGIPLNVELGKIPDCECNPGKINQLIMNLIDNAIYAVEKKDIMNEEGLITITSSNNDSSIIFSVKDNGIGMTEETKGKLFDPFYTTKDVGEGTGLGLSIVRSIVDAHQGKITVNSEVSVGTEVIVEIPIKSIRP